MTRNQLVLENMELKRTAQFALDRLCEMTSDQFARGQDRPIRRRLAEVLGLEPDDYSI